MIVELLLDALGLILSGLDALIPDVPLPFESEILAGAATVGSALAGLNTFLPIEEWAEAVSWGLAFYVPFALGYIIIRWVLGHVPFVGGK